MKVLYTSDLHGQRHLYEELLNLAEALSPDIVILGGDLFPSFSPSKRYEDMIPYQGLFINQFLSPFLKRITERSTAKRIFTIAGNWDLGYPLLFETPAAEIIDLNEKRHCLENGYELIGYPFVPPTPFRPKEYEKMDDIDSPWPPQKYPSYVRSEDRSNQVLPVDPYVFLKQRRTIETDLAQLVMPLDLMKTAYIMHSPPFGTRLDVIHGGKRAGSRSIREFIEKNQPHLTLHGHIHESPDLSGGYEERIGKTLSVNPGQFGVSRLHAVIFELENPAETLFHTVYS